MKFIKLNTANMIAQSELSSIEIERYSDGTMNLVAYKKSGEPVRLGRYNDIDTANEALSALTDQLNMDFSNGK